MAEVLSALCLSHSPYLYTPPEIWAKAMGTKSFRDDVPRDRLVLPGLRVVDELDLTGVDPAMVYFPPQELPSQDLTQPEA